METLSQNSGSTTFIAIAAIFAAILIAILILKQFFKILILVILLVLLYIAYLFFTGQKIPEDRKEMMQQGTKQLEMLREKGSRFIPAAQ